ncbi:MAG: hypothetical protein ACLFUU_11660 [Desulfobacteraceae bacterium]
MLTNIIDRDRWQKLVLCLIMLTGILAGCQMPEPPLSPEATAFKERILEIIQEFSQPLVGPTAERDIKSIQTKLEKLYRDADQDQLPTSFTVGVLDKQGVALTAYPDRPYNVQVFLNYHVVVKALEERRIVQARLFFQNGSKLYVICSPLLRQAELKGLLILCFDAAEADRKWGITEEEFLALNFNHR